MIYNIILNVSITVMFALIKKKYIYDVETKTANKYKINIYIYPTTIKMAVNITINKNKTSGMIQRCDRKSGQCHGEQRNHGKGAHSL